jgi:predicted metalloprotease with PDZ domain
MLKPWFPRVVLAAALVSLAAPARAAETREPVVSAIRFLAPESQTAEVEASLPTGGREAVELMMPVWAPGFYAVQNHAGRVQDFAARTPDGRGLRVERPQKNRWWVETAGAPVVVVSYRLTCTGRSVTTNWVSADHAVLNGSVTFITLVESARRPHEVRLELPPKWKVSATGLDPAPTGLAHNYRAPDYDTLNDSPIRDGQEARRHHQW